MLRTRVRIHDHTYFLAQGTDPRELQAQIVDAARAGAGFVRFVEVGNRNVSVLVTPGITILFEEEVVAMDHRDDGDVTSPFDAPIDARSYAALDFIDY